MLNYFYRSIKNGIYLVKNTKNITKKKKSKPTDTESIEALKKQIKHQKDALKKINKNYSK